ncbi:MAG: carboxypeptidase regulatory-like domain-containing protein [Candidatus Binatia bacterium]
MPYRLVFHWCPVVACTAMVALGSLANAASVAISPPRVQNDYGGQITLTITNLNPGQTVAVDRYADLNGNGTIDPGEPLVQHFTLTDGQVPLIGGQRNLNVPGDDDGATDGRIEARLYYPGVDSLDRIAAPYLYRVSDPANGFPPVTGSLNVVQNTTLTQGVSGTITATDTGLPLPHILVALVANNLSSGTVTDANGRYTLYAPPGAYTIIPVAPGLVADMAAGSVNVTADAFVTKDLALATGNLTVSGKVSDVSTGAGLAGTFMMLQSSTQLFVGVFADSTGKYTAQVTSGQWGITPNQETVAALGYVGTKDKNTTSITGNVTLDFPLQKATALVFGTVKDDQGHPVLGMRMSGRDQTNQYQPNGRTFSPNADYAIGVFAGTWNVGPNQDDLVALGYISQGATLTVQDGHALRQDFTLQRFTATAHVSGRLVENTTTGPGISNMNVSACLQSQAGGTCLSATTASDGSFDIGLFAGTWNLGFSSDRLTQLNLVGPQFTIPVVDGENLSGFVAVALPATAHINGSVRDSQSNLIAGVNVYAFASVNGTNYNANGQTDEHGAYSLLVINGNWQVGLDCNSLTTRGFVCANNQPVVIANADQTVDFLVQSSVSACTGDCNGDHHVTVDEILAMVNIALGNINITQCQAGDANADGRITVDEILAAVNNALNGCPATP